MSSASSNPSVAPASGGAALVRRLRPSLPKSGRSTLLATIAVGGLILGWWVLALVIDNPQMMPTPQKIAATIWENFTTTDPLGKTGWSYLLVTLQRIVIGFGLAMALGCVIGILMGISANAEGLFKPIVTTGLAIPAVAWVVLAIMWFGVTEWSGIFVVTIDILPYIVVSMWEGTKAVDRDLVSMSNVFGASRRQVWRRIYIPHLGPYIFSSIRYGFALAWKIVLIVEVFGLPNGVGSIFEYWYAQFNMTQVFAWTATFAIVIIVIENAIIGPARKYAFRWMPTGLSSGTRRPKGGV